MKPARANRSPVRVIALALTWDGVRWPVRTLSPKARAFLASHPRELPSARKMAALFAGDEVKEIRVCWVPRLKCGSGVLSAPFSTPSGTRLGFRATRMTGFGDVLGVVYRRA